MILFYLKIENYNSGVIKEEVAQIFIQDYIPIVIKLNSNMKSN